MYRKLPGLLAALLLTGAAPGAIPGTAAAGPGTAGDHPADEAVAGAPGAGLEQAGTIEGVLRLRPRPQRRTADRYGSAPSVTKVQEIPPAVWLEGVIGSAPAPMEPKSMAQQDTSFAPPLLVITPGTTVRFPNQDPFFHNVFSYSAGSRFDLGRYPRGESKDVTFDEAGIVKVYCEVHESMRAAIVVVENRYWARPGEDGAFRIADVPAGRYTLVAWQADRGETRREIQVGDGVTRVELEL